MDPTEEVDVTRHQGPGTVVATLQSKEGAVYKIVEYQLSSGMCSFKLETVVLEDVPQLQQHLASSTEDGTGIHLQQVDGVQVIPPFNQDREPVSLFRLEDFGALQGLIEGQAELGELKILGHPEQEYVELFEAEPDPAAGPLTLVEADTNVTEGGTEQESPVKEAEPSTRPTLDLDLGCEWSLALPFGFQGTEIQGLSEKLVLNVWHFFKQLKKYPERLSETNAQGLAGQALNVGTKTIGRIGKAYRDQQKLECIMAQHKKRERVRECTKRRKMDKQKKELRLSTEEEMDTSTEPLAGALHGGKGGARAGSSGKSGLCDGSSAAAITGKKAGQKRTHALKATKTSSSLHGKAGTGKTAAKNP